MNYGKIMAEMIDWSGMTAVEVAKRGNISIPTLRRQLRRITPTLDVFFTVVKVTGYPIEDILGEYTPEDVAAIKLFLRLPPEKKKTISTLLRQL